MYEYVCIFCMLNIQLAIYFEEFGVVNVVDSLVALLCGTVVYKK